MTIQFGAHSTTSLNVTPVDAAVLHDWHVDLGEHHRQNEARLQAINRQTYLMEYLRVGCSQSCRWDGFVANDHSFTTPTAPLRGSIEAAQQELEALDQQIIDIEEQLRRLEDRILMFEPASQSDALLQMRFVSDLMANGKKIAQSYVADVLDAALKALAEPKRPVETAPLLN